MTNQTTESQDEITIEECPNEEQIPFTMVSNDLIRAKLSPNCIWLIIYLLSNKPGWKINVRQIINHVKGFIGKNQLYEIIDEALESGYMDRQEYKVNNLKRYKYYVSRTPKFKKSLRCPENRDTESRDTENRDGKEQLLGEKTILKKQQQQPAAALPKQEKKELKDPINVNLLYIEIPDSEKRWISEHYEDADIRHAVAWANHPETKIKATLEQAIKWACVNKPAIPSTKEDNRKVATEVQKHVRVPLHLKNIWKMEILTSYVEIICGSNCQVLEYCEKQFREKLMELIRKSGCVLS